jgi:hypothetical protein
LSVVKELQATQASPPDPHAPVERALQVGPEQQPDVHVDAHPVQTPFEQLSPPGQVPHSLPPLPQAPPVLPGWQRLAEQQPVGHDVPSQTQTLLRQRWPDAHAAPLPHLHSPADVHESAVTPHAAQVAPGVPQAESEREVQAPWSQQPSGHDVASQTQTSWEQCRPAPHAGPVPQWQVPVSSQVSVLTELHAWHVEPCTPHCASVRVSHVVPWQQPSGQDVASHTHRPLSQRCPAPHSAPPPHVQAPVVAEHPSALVASHATQALPAAPQVALEGGE